MPKKVSFMFEISRQCNQRCSFCYNTWKVAGESRRRPLGTKQTEELLDKLISDTECHSISLSGGEPMLRKDVFDIISFIKSRNVKVCLLSNGTRLTNVAIKRCLSAGVDVFQITLLGDTPKLHNRLAGAQAFERVLDAVLNIKNRGGVVHINFVAMSENVSSFRNVLELCFLMGVNNVSFDRFVPGGEGLQKWTDLLPPPDAIDDALAECDEIVGKYNMSVSVSTPILPCLNDVSRYGNIGLSRCAVGDEEHALFCIDPEGNLKMCSHSPHVLGNLLERSFTELLEDPFLVEFENTVPSFCRDCAAVADCRGGCRSSAHVCYGNLASEEPYLQLWKSRAKKPVARKPIEMESHAQGNPELKRR